MNIHETTITGRLNSFLHKGAARVFGQRGWRLNLKVAQLPSATQMDLVRTALHELEACPGLSSELPRHVGVAFELLHSALIVPDLRFRSDCLRLAKSLIDRTTVLSTAVTRSKVERDEMYDSSDRVDIVRAYLESAVFQLDCCFHWTDNSWGWAKTNPEARVQRTLNAATDRVLSARANMPML